MASPWVEFDPWGKVSFGFKQDSESHGQSFDFGSRLSILIVCSLSKDDIRRRIASWLLLVFLYPEYRENGV